MTKSLTFLLLLVFPGVFGTAAKAEAPKKIPRIGLLRHDFVKSWIAASQERLRELGYVNGENIIVEWRHGAGDAKRLPSLAAELVQLKVDVLVPAGPFATRAAIAATTTIPIVFSNADDPVKEGFVASLGRPSGNVTGVFGLTQELLPKRLELLKQTVPDLARVAVLMTPGNRYHAQRLRNLELTARSLGIALQPMWARQVEELPAAFAATAREHTEAFMTMGGRLSVHHKGRLARLAIKHHLPAISRNKKFVRAGGLMSYGMESRQHRRRAIDYVDKILKGAKPADLPVERLKQPKLAINLKTAKRIGIVIPPRVLMKADDVIR